jgi:hypothetical protein
MRCASVIRSAPGIARRRLRRAATKPRGAVVDSRRRNRGTPQRIGGILVVAHAKGVEPDLAQVIELVALDVADRAQLAAIGVVSRSSRAIE